MGDIDRKARVVLVGCGNQASRAIYPCVAAATDVFEVLATCDLDQVKAQQVAGRTGAQHTFTDVETALEQTKPDGVFVIGPPGMQGSVAAQVLERGIPVFTEKPSAPTVAGAKRLVQLAAVHETWGMTGFMKRFNDAYRAARDCLGRPEFGRPMYLEKQFYAQNPHRREGQSDGDLLWNVLIMQGTHALDLVRFFTGGHCADPRTGGVWLGRNVRRFRAGGVCIGRNWDGAGEYAGRYRQRALPG